MFTGTVVAPAAGTVEITVGAPVVKVQTKLALRALPPGSCAPVVTVAVYTVLAANEAVGVNWAVVPAIVTAPATGVDPGPVNVNVVELIVALFINELKFADTATLRATPVAPFAGNRPITVGEIGLGACSRPHPATRATNTNATKDIFPTLNLRISFSCSTGSKALLFPFHGRRTFETLNLSYRVLAPIPIEFSGPPRAGYSRTVAAAGLGHASC